MRRIRQENFFPVIIASHLLLWLVDLSRYSGDYPTSSLHVTGEIFSSWAVTVIAVNFLMATRACWVERLFGGLDKMYMIHRRSGIIAVSLLVLHFIVVPRDPGFTIGKPLGFLALVLLLIGVILSAVPFVQRIFPYHRWRITHKLMGLAYILGVAHAMNVPTLTAELPLVRAYVLGMVAIGVASWFYRAFLSVMLTRKIPYLVVAITHFDNDTSELTLQPITEKTLNYRPGQFAFFSIADLGSREAHPFTLSSHPANPNLRITVKALGDYSAKLQNKLEVGAQVAVEGPFGLFDYSKLRYPRQIWLAGGIGITPFLSFLEDLGDEREVTLVWSVSSTRGADYREEIEKLAATKPNLRFILNVSNEEGRFTIDRLYRSADLKAHSVMICGPEPMREAYIEQLLQKGVSIRDIHFEEFSFR